MKSNKIAISFFLSIFVILLFNNLGFVSDQTTDSLLLADAYYFNFVWYVVFHKIEKTKEYKEKILPKQLEKVRKLKEKL